MREAMRERDFESLRSEIETRLARKRMRPLRDCVDRAGLEAPAPPIRFQAGRL
jgi:hypothetical protein